MSQIDAIDQRILAELQANGRLTMKSLAERVGLSSPAMIERVRRLEDKGVIVGYRAIVAPAALGRSVATFISAKVDPSCAAEFMDGVKNDPSIVECHRITGEHGYLLKAHVQDMTALQELSDRLSALGATLDISVLLSSPLPWREVITAESMAADATGNQRRTRKLMHANTVRVTSDHSLKSTEPTSRTIRVGTRDER